MKWQRGYQSSNVEDRRGSGGGRMPGGRLGLGAIVHAVRVAVAGKPVGFGLFDILALLGRARVLARLARTLRVLEATANLPEVSGS